MPIATAESPKKPKTKVVKTKPTFFHANLNGNGSGVRGALTKNTNPGQLDPRFPENRIATVRRKHTNRNGEIKIRSIPTSIVTEAMVNLAMTHEFQLDIPNVESRFEIGTYTPSTQPDVTYTFSYTMTPQAIELREEGPLAAGRSVIVRYRLDVYATCVEETEARYVVKFKPKALTSTKRNYATTMFTTNPVRTLREFIDTHLPLDFDEERFDEQMDAYNVANELIKLADAWQADDASSVIETLIPQAAQQIMNNDDVRTVFHDQIEYLNSYSINLDGYQRIYTVMADNLDSETVSHIAKANMNLQFADIISELGAAKKHIRPLPDVEITVSPFFSAQQREVICTREPLVIVDAGAGAGKSTTLDGILDGLNQFGVPDSNMLVTSFTNTAADNMRAKRPNIRSMTMASMIHEIYSLNFPTHELSSIETLANCLRIALPNSVTARDLETLLFNTQNNKGLGPFTDLSIFIESNYDEVLACLNEVKQTTLELESIICYQRIDEIIEPDHIRTEFMLIDEVQDNSVFEFIYVLKRAAKLKQHLYLIGDPSQVLFEFRNANPKALNTMETSGVFATYKLTTNYRSNQEVLDFTNKFLLDIEANQFAKIQLHSHQVSVPSVETLRHNVQVNHIRVNTLKEFHENFHTIVGRNMTQFVDEALAKNEKVAFIARTRKHAKAFEELLSENYPDREIAFMVPDVAYTYTAFTSFIRHYWDSITPVPSGNVPFTIHKMMTTEDVILKILPKANDAARRVHTENVNKWWSQNAQTITAWVHAEQSGAMARVDFFENVKRSMIDYEISLNAVRTSVVRQRNQERKDRNASSNASFIVSTIHSVKGLEFDNVVAIYEDKDPMPEEYKRMYYVAFTRAKNRLLVIGFGTGADPAITTNYATLVAELEAMEAQGVVTSEEEHAQYDASGEENTRLIGGFTEQDVPTIDESEV